MAHVFAQFVGRNCTPFQIQAWTPRSPFLCFHVLLDRPMVPQGAKLHTRGVPSGKFGLTKKERHRLFVKTEPETQHPETSKPTYMSTEEHPPQKKSKYYKPTIKGTATWAKPQDKWINGNTITNRTSGFQAGPIQRPWPDHCSRLPGLPKPDP